MGTWPSWSGASDPLISAADRVRSASSTGSQSLTSPRSPCLFARNTSTMASSACAAGLFAAHVASRRARRPVRRRGHPDGATLCGGSCALEECRSELPADAVSPSVQRPERLVDRCQRAKLAIRGRTVTVERRTRRRGPPCPRHSGIHGRARAPASKPTPSTRVGGPIRLLALQIIGMCAAWSPLSPRAHYGRLHCWRESPWMRSRPWRCQTARCRCP